MTAARQAQLRFGPLASDEPPFPAGSQVPVWCDLRDVLTGRTAQAAGVTFRWLPPDRAVEIRQAATAQAPGTWYASLAAAMPGVWLIRAEVTDGAILAERAFRVRPTLFSAEATPAPLLVTDAGEVLVLDTGAAIGG